jgi:hypothetical protein
MGPYRQAAVDEEAELDRKELDDFAAVHALERTRSLAGGLSFSFALIAAGLAWAVWFYVERGHAFARFP